MKLEQALRIMMTTVLSTSFTHGHNDALSNRKLSSVEDVVGTGCRNTVDFHARFKTDDGADCVSSTFCDGSTVNDLFIPKAKDVCIKFNEANCNVFEVVTAFDEEWMMKHITLKASGMGAATDPKSVTFLASNDSVKWEVLHAAEVKFTDRQQQAEFVVSNDSSYKYYSAQFHSDQDIMHLGKHGLVEDYTKACTSQMHEGITGKLVSLYTTLSPTSVPTITPTSQPTDVLGHEFSTYWELKGAINLTPPDRTRKFGHMKTWRVGKITAMNHIFNGMYNFNEDVSQWDTSAVTTMKLMLMNAYKFNINISKWNVSRVTNMHRMFEQAYKFNSDLSDWNVGVVTDMVEMFYHAKEFEQVICWDASKAKKDRVFAGSKGGTFGTNC